MSKQFATILLTLGLALNFSAPATADILRGKTLHNTHCMECHISLAGGDGSGIYTREDRRMEDLEMLNKQVRRCRDSLGFPWPEDQVNDVVNYLDKNFYHFTDGNITK